MSISPNGINIEEVLEELASYTIWYPAYEEAMRLVNKVSAPRATVKTPRQPC